VSMMMLEPSGPSTTNMCWVYSCLKSTKIYFMQYGLDLGCGAEFETARNRIVLVETETYRIANLTPMAPSSKDLVPKLLVQHVQI
jgi:hypothetical protein